MILMLNCSYKGKEGNTHYFLKVLKNQLSPEQKCRYLQIKNVLKTDLEQFVEELRKADALVIGAPLYVDGLPAQAVKLLELLLKNYKDQFPNLSVYVVSNLGFYEGMQIQNLLSIVENWCRRMGMAYGGGLAVGAGPMISTLQNISLKSGLNKDIGAGFVKMAQAISDGKSMGNYYTKTAIPRVIYLKAAHMTFGKTAKANGLSVEDIS